MPPASASETAMEQRLGAPDLAAKPVSAGSPAGEWIRYEAEFESLKSEIDQLSVDPKATDWQQVVSLSSEILGERSKDLLVGCYLAAGLYQLKGFRGLEEGLEALSRMASTYWDGLFPPLKRNKARASAVTWLVDRQSEIVDPEQTRPEDREAIEGCLRQVETLSGFFDEKLGPSAPAFGPLRRGLKAAVQELERAQAPPEPPPKPRVEKAPAAAPTPAPKPPAPAPAATPEISSSREAERALVRTLAPLKKIGRLLRPSDPADPRAYQLGRIVAWLRMTELPRNTDGLTNLPPEGASPALAERYQALADTGEWSRLLEQAESQFERSVLWLDAQRFVALALSELGDAYRGAHRVVVGELATLIRRFPQLPQLRFANDTPLAAAETREWLAGVVAGTAGDAAPAAAAPVFGDEDEELEQVLAQAGQMAREKQLPRAVAELRRLVAEAGGRSRGFSRRLALARFLADARQHRLAIAQLEHLDEEVRRFRLEEWDPALALEVLRLFLGCQNQMIRGEWKKIPEAAARARELFSRLARIDAAAALGLQ